MSQSDSAYDYVKRYGTLAYEAFGTMLDTGLIVIGTLLVGLGVSILLGGFDIFGSLPDLSTGAMLGSSLILSIVGMFALGVAAEGPLGRGKQLSGYSIWEIGIGRSISSFLVGFGLLLVHSFVVGLIDDLPEVLARGAEGIHSVAVAGMVVVPLVGVPLSLLIRSAPEEYGWARRYQIPAIFVVWVIATMILL